MPVAADTHIIAIETEYCLSVRNRATPSAIADTMIRDRNVLSSAPPMIAVNWRFSFDNATDSFSCPGGCIGSEILILSVSSLGSAA